MSTANPGGCSFAVQPYRQIKTNENVEAVAVFKFGPLPATTSLVASNLHAFLCIGDMKGNAFADQEPYTNQTGQGKFVTGNFLNEDPADKGYVFFMFHNIKFLRPGTYKIGVFLMEDVLDGINMGQRWSREFTVGEGATDMRRSPDEELVLEKLRNKGVFGS
ncbi:hypothetical protein B0T20DRAFT_410056 [Sordaria brevicollis]|uniref:Uncharacterized protein n=1 Tax=Sordaria brevicollis TaxID=83679 RepID=A0AAE0UCW5_SORBR|nr:hypothetical protein B0T20DRAFT_410056 [Sordaria brevicollis]